jgi:hypothetical protein
MNAGVEAAVRDLLDSPALDQAASNARQGWIRQQFGIGTSWSVPEGVVTLGHQVSLLATGMPSTIDEIPVDLRIRLESLAGCLDIAARMTEERAREFAKLAATIYLVAQQPTRALRVIRRLRVLDRVDAAMVPLHRILETAYQMQGSRTVDAVTDAVSGAAFGELGHTLQEGLLESISDPAAFRVLREIEIGLRYRELHDIRGVASALLPAAYLARAYEGPSWSRRSEFLPSQLSVVNDGYLEDDRSFVSTPTGTGKTFLAELRIAHELRGNPDALIAYVAPLNALARQVHRDLRRRLVSVGDVTLWTGAYEIDPTVEDLGNVLVTTPEKLDSILRLDLASDPRSEDLRKRLSLVIADEAHQTGDGPRGVLYEFLLLRLKRRFDEMRLVALSAVQANPAPFARFLSSQGTQARVHEVQWSATSVWDLLWTKGGELRARREISDPPRLARPKQTKAAGALAAATLLQQVESILLVESRRDWAESLAAEIYAQYRDYLEQRLLQNAAGSDGAVEQLEDLALEIQERLYENHPLANFVRVGLAVHHAGLPPTIRRRIEELARRQLIHTVVATTTLAEGVDLPFRAVVLCRLALPFGQPFRAARIRNIRGRAARPGYAADGIFLVLEPENVDTAAYQYFRDHYWDESVETVESPSALGDLFSTEPIRFGPVMRSLESQLMAFFSENEVEPSAAGGVAAETLFSEVFESGSIELSRLAGRVQEAADHMLEAPALLQGASPMRPTGFGRAAILGGLSASSALLVRDALLVSAPEFESIVDEGGIAELAIRLAWLPWEAVESTDEYRNTLSRRKPFNRSVGRLDHLVDGRLDAQYGMARLLLSRRLLPEIAEAEPEAIRGRTSDDRLARLVEWGGRTSGVLPWALTGVLRIAESLAPETAELFSLQALVAPYVQYLAAWVPAQGGAELVRRGLVDRDSVLRLLRSSELWDASAFDLLVWARDNEAEARELVGERQYAYLLQNAPDEPYEDESD